MKSRMQSQSVSEHFLARGRWAGAQVRVREHSYFANRDAGLQCDSGASVPRRRLGINFWQIHAFEKPITHLPG